MNTIQSPAPGTVAPGPTELDAANRSSAPAAARSLADVILLAGIAAANNNELRIKAAYQEVLYNTRMLQNLRECMTKANQVGDRGWNYEHNGTVHYQTGHFIHPETGAPYDQGIHTYVHFATGTNHSDSRDKVADKKAFLADIDRAITTYSEKNQIAMQNLQAAVSKQNEYNQLISQNMSKLHEVSQASLSKMG